jgi:hypothetical protein
MSACVTTMCVFTCVSVGLWKVLQGPGLNAVCLHPTQAADNLLGRPATAPPDRAPASRGAGFGGGKQEASGTALGWSSVTSTPSKPRKNLIMRVKRWVGSLPLLSALLSQAVLELENTFRSDI